MTSLFHVLVIKCRCDARIASPCAAPIAALRAGLLAGLTAALLASVGCAREPARVEPQAQAVPSQPADEPVTAIEPLAAPQPAPSAEVVVRSEAPERYTVVRGDTLWDISARFLRDPWLWPEIWDVNPQIGNPHLIYPGDIISLLWVDGRPRLQVERGDQLVGTRGADGVVRWSPQVRAEALDDAIPLVSADAIHQFTVRPRVVTKEQLEAAPYVIGNYDGRLISATDHQVYVRGLQNREERQYSVFRPGKPLIDPQSEEILGYEAIYVADSRVLEFGDPATLLITDNNRETLAGDRLLPLDRSKLGYNIVPRQPELPLDGLIISLFDAISHVGQNQVVVINLGQRDGMSAGDVLAIERRGGSIVDRYSGVEEDVVDLPDTRIGVLMVFRVFDRVSYGLIVQSTRATHLNDAVTNL